MGDPLSTHCLRMVLHESSPPRGHDGHVQIDPSGQGTDQDPSDQQTYVEHIPPGLGLPPLECEVEERGEDEGEDGGGQAAH